MVRFFSFLMLLSLLLLKADADDEDEEEEVEETVAVAMAAAEGWMREEEAADEAPWLLTFEQLAARPLDK